MTGIIEEPSWKYRPDLCTCLPDWSGACFYHDFDDVNGEAASAAVTALMEKLGMDPENDDWREPVALLLEPVLDVYLLHLAENARDPEGGDWELYTLAEIRDYLKGVRHD